MSHIPEYLHPRKKKVLLGLMQSSDMDTSKHCTLISMSHVTEYLHPTKKKVLLGLMQSADMDTSKHYTLI